MKKIIVERKLKKEERKIFSFRGKNVSIIQAERNFDKRNLRGRKSVWGKCLGKKSDDLINEKSDHSIKKVV